MSHKDEKKDQHNTNGLTRRRLLKRGAVLGGISALAGAFGLTPLTARAAVQGGSSTQVVALTGSEAQQYIGMTLGSPYYQSFRTAQSVRLKEGFTLREGEATALLITSATEKVVAVRVPIAGGAGYSFYGELIQYGSSTVTETLAGLFTARSDHNIAAQIWRQGKEVLNAVITPDGKQFVQGYVAHPAGQQTLDGAATPLFDIGCWWNQMNSCLASQGIAAWAVALVSVVCGVACAATLGAGCIACLGGISFISGAVIGYCTAYAQDHCS